MDAGSLILLVQAVLFVSVLIRSTFGFGNALLAMPLLVLLIGIKGASPLVALVGVVVSLMMVLRGWQALQWKDILSLLLASIPGILLGLLLLNAVPETIVKAVLGVVLIGFGLYSLLGVQLPRVDGGWLVLPFGLLAGLLGGAYNANGPPVVIYGVFRGWNKDHFRASLQGFFLISSLLIVAGQGLSGLWTPQILLLFLLSIPLVALAVFLGERLASGISQDTFNKWIYYFLILMGALMFL